MISDKRTDFVLPAKYRIYTQRPLSMGVATGKIYTRPLNSMARSMEEAIALIAKDLESYNDRPFPRSNPPDLKGLTYRVFEADWTEVPADLIRF